MRGGRPLAAAARLPVAAALFLPPQDAQGNPGGATSRPGLAAARCAMRTLDMALSARIGDAREGGRKRQMPQQPAASRPGAVPHSFTPRHGRNWRRGEHRHPQVHRCSTQPSEKHLGRRLFLLKPLRHNPRGARRAQERQHHADRSRHRRNPGRRRVSEELAEWMQLYRATRDSVRRPANPSDETCPF